MIWSKKNIYEICLLVLLVSMLPFFGFSQKDTLNEQLNMLNLEELSNIKITSASKATQTVSEAPANVIVITANEIEQRGYRTLEEVMKDLPGFDFATGQPSGEYPTHFLFRGMGAVGQTKFIIMLNGIPLNDISNGWARNIGFNFILEDVERIEFVSGPGSSLYGLNAYAGYINVITKREFEKVNGKNYGVTTSVSGGNYKTFFPELYSWNRFKNGLALQLSARYYYSEGDYGLNRYDPGNYFHNNYEPDSVMTSEHGMIANEKDSNGKTKKLNDGFNTSINDYYVRANLSKEDFTIGFNFWDKKEGLGSEVVGYEYFTNQSDIDYKAHHSGKSFNMNYRFDLTDKISGRSKAYFMNTTILPQTGFTYTYQYQGVDNGIDPAVKDKKKTYDSEGFLIGFDQQLNYKFNENNNLVIGAQFEQQIREYFNITIEDTLRNLIGGVEQKIPLQNVYFSKNGAVLLQDEIRLTEKFRITAGFRYDINQFYGKVFNPRLALVRSNNKGMAYKLIYSKGYRAPTIFELFDEWRGNADLRPEHIHNLEGEVGYNCERGFILGNIFASQMKDLIMVAENPDTSVVKVGKAGQHKNYYQNVGDQLMYGALFRAKCFMTKQFVLDFNYQYTASNVELTNVAPHKVNLGITYQLKDKLSFNIRANWQNKVKAPSTNLYFYEKTAATIAQVGYNYVTENNSDGYLNGRCILNATIRGKNIIKIKSMEVEPQLIVRNILNTQYANMGRQTGDGLRPIDSIQPQVNNPQGFIPAYHPQIGREIFIGLKFKL